MLIIIINQALIGCFDIAFGRLVLQSVLSRIPFQSDFLGSNQLDIIEFSSIGLEKAFDMLQIFPFRRQIKIHHHGEDHPVITGSGIVPEDQVPHLRNCFAVISAKDLDHGLYGHVIMEKSQIRDFHQFLSDGHFPDSSVSKNEYKFHVFFRPFICSQIVFQSGSPWLARMRTDEAG